MNLLALPAIPREVVDPDHLPAVVLAVLVPLVLAAGLFGLAALAVSGVAPAARALDRLAGVPASARVLAFLLLLDAVVHLGLVPDHARTEPLLAFLFALSAAALVATAIWVLRLPGWHLPALALLLANVFAYAYVVNGGWEEMDGVGMACKLLELAALAMVTVDAARHAARATAELTRG